MRATIQPGHPYAGVMPGVILPNGSKEAIQQYDDDSYAPTEPVRDHPVKEDAADRRDDDR